MSGLAQVLLKPEELAEHEAKLSQLESLHLALAQVLL
jgi:hypothetical protein